MNPRPHGPKPCALPNYATPGFFKWRRRRDSNPRPLSESLVFETSSLSHSDTSPYLEAGGKRWEVGYEKRGIRCGRWDTYIVGFSTLDIFTSRSPISCISLLISHFSYPISGFSVPTSRFPFLNGDPSATRTRDSLIKSQVLCRLS